jgi:Domain of unknown function (DUF1905)
VSFGPRGASKAAKHADILEMSFSGELWYWRGPSPFHFVTVPDGPSAAIHAISRIATYGWGVIPVRVRIGESLWETSLFPKDGRYLVPVKDAVRKAERLAVGDTVAVQLAVRS